MAEHTNLPLSVAPCGLKIVDNADVDYAYLSFRIQGAPAAKPVLWWGKRAAHIVKCVNMHDKLVAACEDFASIKGDIPRFPGSIFLEVARDLAIAAIKD